MSMEFASPNPQRFIAKLHAIVTHPLDVGSLGRHVGGRDGGCFRGDRRELHDRQADAKSRPSIRLNMMLLFGSI